MATAFQNIVNLSNGKSEFTYKEIKKQCIMRGIDFENVIEGDVLGLSNWLLKNQTKEADEALIIKFDDWLDKRLAKMKLDYLVHPGLRLSHLGDTDTTIINANIPNSKPKKAKAKREKDSSGLYKGTKKQYTFDLQRKGKSIEQVIKKVCRKFPEAKIKSVKIWFNRSRKENAT